MTTSISNASAQARPATARRKRVKRSARAERDHVRETGPTAASRLVILLLCVVLVLSTLAYGTVHAWSIALFAAGAGVAVLLWTLDAWRSRRLRLSLNPLQLPLVGLFVVGLIQLLPFGEVASPTLSTEPVRALSHDPHSTRWVLVVLGSLIIYFSAALAFIDSHARLRLVTRAIIIFGFLLALFGLLQHFVSPDKIYGIRETKQALAFGPFINRHHFATYMVMVAGLPLGLLFAGAVERDKRFIYLFSALLMGVALVMTNSRGGMLAICAEVFFLVVVSGLLRRDSRAEDEEGRPSRPRALAVRAAGGVGLVLAVVAGVVMFGGDEALNRLLGSVNAEDPTTGRLHFWRGTIEIIRAHPFLGAGLGAFSAIYPRYDTSSGSVFRLEQAHNDYLQLLADAGVVGAALGLLFVVILFRTALKRMQAESPFRRGVALGALAGCFAALVHSFFDFPLHMAANALLFLTLSALATVNGRTDQATRRKRRRNSIPTTMLDAGMKPGVREASAPGDAADDLKFAEDDGSGEDDGGGARTPVPPA